MNNLIKLGLAAALGAGAVILNLWWLNSRPKDPTFVSINKSVTEGTEITPNDLVAIAIPGKVEELKKSFIPWDDRALIYNRRAVRNFTLGDIFLQRDVQGGPPQFDVLGPFRIISVGEHYRSQSPEEKVESDGSNSSNTVTVEVRHYHDKQNRYYFDDKTRRLMQFIEGGNGSGSSRRQKIVTLQVYKKGKVLQEVTPADGDQFDEVHLIIPLNDVDIVRKVLAVGDDIGFVVPTRL